MAFNAISFLVSFIFAKLCNEHFHLERLKVSKDIKAE